MKVMQDRPFSILYIDEVAYLHWYSDTLMDYVATPLNAENLQTLEQMEIEYKIAMLQAYETEIRLVRYAQEIIDLTKSKLHDTEDSF